jgi:hypothetical protein
MGRPPTCERLFVPAYKLLADRQELLRRRFDAHVSLLNLGQVRGDLLGGTASAQELNDRAVVPVVLACSFGPILDTNRIPSLHEELPQLLPALVLPPFVIFRELHRTTISTGASGSG